MEDTLVDRDHWVMVDLGTAPLVMSSYDWKNLDRKAKSPI
jgi:hypothetical protein